MGTAMQKLASATYCKEDGPPNKKQKKESSYLTEDDMDVDHLLPAPKEKEGGDEATEDEANDILTEISNELNADGCGQQVSSGLAKIVDRRFKTTMSFDICSKRK